jgi:dienelactone hydrolase
MKFAAFAITSLLCLASIVHGEIKSRAIEYKAGDTILEGYLAYDDALVGKRPGVLIVHEWWGHDEYVRQRARQIAELGYVAFAVDMFGKGVKTDSPEEAAKLAGPVGGNPELTVERFTAALDVLKQQEQVDERKIGAMGYCFGGSIVLQAARAGLPLAGVVSFHGALGTTTPAREDTLVAKIQVHNGADDAFVSADELATFQKEMQAAKADWLLVQHGNAVHSFTNPKADERKMNSVAYNEAADTRSWEMMKAFWAEVFR